MKISSNPLVSVVVSTYKRPYFLAKTLKTILSQTYKNLEILVVDDGSEDSTAETVKKFNDKRIKFLEITHSGRPAVPRNYGLYHATGEFIAFCDDDDLWDPQKIKKQVKVFIQNSSIKLCYTEFSLINEDDKEIKKTGNSTKNSTTFEKHLLKNDVTFSTVMIHKDIFLEGLRFDERPILKASEDFLFIGKILSMHPVSFIADTLVKYRIHQNGISYSHNSTKKLFAYYYRIMLCFYEFFKLKKISFAKWLYLAYFHMVHTIKLILFPYFKNLRRG